MIDLGRRLHRSVRGSVAQPLRAGAPRQATLAIAVDEPLDCDSGSGRIFGTVNDNGTGTVSIQYNACRSDGTTLTGSATMRVDAFDPFFGFDGLHDQLYPLDAERLRFCGPNRVVTFPPRHSDALGDDHGKCRGALP